MRINIQYKITLIFGIIGAIILLGIYVYLNNNLTGHAYQRAGVHLKKQTALVKSFLEKHITGDEDPLIFDEIVNEISKNLDVRATIISLDGTVIADSEIEPQFIDDIENHLYRAEVQQAIKTGIGQSSRFSSTVKKEMLYRAYTFGEGDAGMIIRLAAFVSEIEQISFQLRKTLTISIVLAFISITIISFLVSIFISTPIKKMSIVASNIADGDFSKKISSTSRDEIGDMANAFNYMIDQIRHKIDEVTLSKLRFEAVLLSMFEGVIVVDINGLILLMNQTLKNFFLVEGDVLNKRPMDVLNNIEIQEIADNALKKGQGVEAREIKVINDEEKILLAHATPVLRDDRVEGAVLVFHDITELRRLEKIRQDFVANVSHELRTPMSSIKGYAETLLDGALDDKKYARDFLNIIYSESGRMATLVDEILDLSRIESGKLKMVLAPCKLASIVSRTIAAVGKQAGDKSITIKKFIPEGLPDLLADESKISQILLNLLDNAIKYNNEGGEIFVSAKDVILSVRIDVIDTGIGISEQEQSRVFERFYRANKTHSRELGGTGLGLSIVKHIVNAHNGSVYVKSEPGKGSTFSFTIPKA